MKTINYIIDKAIADFMLMSNEDERRSFIRHWLETDDVLIGSGSQKITEANLPLNVSTDIDTTMLRTAKVKNYGDDTMPRREDVYKALSMKYFLSLSDEDKQKMLNDKVYLESLKSIDKYYTRYIPFEYRKAICGYTDDRRDALSIWDKLMCIEDFDNVTDEQILDLIDTQLNCVSHSYEIVRYLFGDDRAIDLIVKSIETKVAKGEKIRLNSYSQKDMTKTLFFAVAQKLSDECVPNVYCHDMLEIKEYLDFCMKDKRWFIHAKMFDEALANKVFEAQNAYNDLQRYAMIISRCCKCGEIPAYQAKRLKAFSVLIQLYGYNYSQVLPAMLSKFDADGKLIPDETTVNKPKADDSLRYVIIKDGNIKVYKTKDIRDTENVVEQGLALDLTKSQLRKKMDELLEC